MKTIMTRDQANLLVKKFKTLTAKDLETADGSEFVIKGKFGLTTIKLAGSWSQCSVTIENTQHGTLYSTLFDNDFPFAGIKWMFSHRFRCWCAIERHAIKVIDKNNKNLARIDAGSL